jgi:dTDP-glucose 4,6-dehydratase/UDP-glucose 4-epimerase
MTPHLFSYDLGPDVDLLITRSSVEPEIFRGKTIFVTGGTGFFGIWTLSALASIKKRLDGDMRIVALSRNPHKFLAKHPQFDGALGVEFITGDIKNFLLGDLRPDHLIHMATTNAEETFSGEDQLKKLETLYLGTKNVLEQCSPTLEKVLFTSSGVAYGNNNGGVFLESASTAPDTRDSGSALAIGKMTAEYLVAYYAEKFGYRYSVARCFAFAGQYLPMNLHYAFGNFIMDVLEGRDIVVRGDGLDQRSYLYVGDAVAWLLKLLAEPANDIFNVGSEALISIGDLARKVASRSSQAAGVAILSERQDTGNFRRTSYVPSTIKIRLAYPYLREWTNLDQVIDKMLAPRHGLAMGLYTE